MLSACRQTAGVELSIKWPNDLLAPPEFGIAGGRGARKVAGILSEVLPSWAEVRSEGAGLTAVVVGIGINVNWPLGWPPADAHDPDLASMNARATWLNRISGTRDRPGRARSPDVGRRVPAERRLGERAGQARWSLRSTGMPARLSGERSEWSSQTRQCSEEPWILTTPGACLSRRTSVSGPSLPATSFTCARRSAPEQAPRSSKATRVQPVRQGPISLWRSCDF